MGVLPQNQIQLLEFCENHWPLWNAAPTAIGLTAAQVTNFKTRTETARADYDTAQSARLASKAATTELTASVSDMRSSAGELIAQIKAFAELQTNPAAVYAAAQIPEPAAPVPAQAPGKPTNFAVTLEFDGSVTLSWDSTNSTASTGGFFTISRKLPGQTGFTAIGGTPGSTQENRRPFFTDTTVPASAASAGVQYSVVGLRGTRIGTPSDAITVQFGNDGATFTVGNQTTQAFKMAA
ncbi:MAG: hypothetical protein KGS45_06255 [Planctomycetes bacterium]|nr:hypothetical protein [Planctomycetota bacterium]